MKAGKFRFKIRVRDDALIGNGLPSTFEFN